MGNLLLNIGLACVGTLGGVLIVVFLFKEKAFIDIKKKEEEGLRLIEKSKEEAARIINENKERSEMFKKRTEEEVKKREERIEKIKTALDLKEDFLQKREARINEIKLKTASYKEETQSLQGAAERVENEIIEKLTTKTGSRKEDIKKAILDKHQLELETENKKKLVELEESLKENAAKRAGDILINTIQRLCSPTSVETRSVLIKVPKDYIKGKIVGKEGKNIEALEELLEAAIVFNDLPDTISISAFNLVVRRIAEKTIEKLIREKRDITKEVIIKSVKDAEKETDEELYEIGLKALEKMGMKSQDKDFIRTIGRLQYRTSYGQNIMKHSMEVGWIAAILGSEIGLNVNTCKTAGFLHDLGKAIDQDPDVKGSHDQLTKELMEKAGFPEEMVHAAWAHHDAIPQKTPEALIVKAADSVSGGRPGARQDSIDRYIEKITAINETVESFEGVKKSFAMSAGREVRVFVDPERIQDAQIPGMAKDIAHKIEENVVYPGKIRINVIRRTKVTEIAK